MKWIKLKGLRKQYELRSDGDLYATLSWEKTFGSLATCECIDGSYTLKRGGFLHPYVTARKLPFDTDFAKMEMNFGGSGIVQFIHGKSFTFQKLSFWKSNWGFTDITGKMIITITEKSPSYRHYGEVEMEKEARLIKNIALLLIIGWYVITLRREETSSVAMISAAGGS